MKKIGIFYVSLQAVDTLDRLAMQMMKSARKAMPDSYFVQFTDHHSRVLKGVDEIVRKDFRHLGFMEARIAHFADYDHDEMLFLDPDLIVQQDVWDVFQDPFDVALTNRGGKPLWANGDKSNDLSEKMPYNTGVMFSKGTAFWKQVLENMKGMKLDDRHWFGEQEVIGKLAKSDQFNVKILDGDQYNYTPLSAKEDVSEHKIVHYKGNRKQWMMDRINKA